RKATLNGPKPFGYFWAPKVTKRSVILKWPKPLRIRVVFGIRELLRRFGYFWAPKVTKNLYFAFLLTKSHCPEKAEYASTGECNSPLRSKKNSSVHLQILVYPLILVG